jgi:hypothetical protein
VAGGGADYRSGGLMIRTRINPLWILAGGGACGGLGLL